MTARLTRWLTALAGGFLVAGVAPAQAAGPPPGCVPQAAATECSGTLLGARYLIDVPAAWNRTLVLWSHGYEVPSATRGAVVDAPGPAEKQWLLQHGYALAASEYSTQGWALQQAFPDQIAVLDRFDGLGFGKPRRTIAWGASLGGMITAGLVQLHPDRFSAALPMCGVVAGGVGVWNEGLDAEYVFKTLLAPNSTLALVRIPPAGAVGNFLLASQIAAGAQQTAQGKARLALAAAVGDIPGWYTPGSPEPAANDYLGQEANQYAWFQNPDFFFSFALRAELEGRAGGNPSWNTGVDYARQLARSVNRDEVLALYKAAGLSLEADLQTLAAGPRISADPAALAYLERYIIYNGELDQPVLTMHTTGDGLVLNSDEQAYASVVRSEGDRSLLRQTFVHRAGHCAFLPSEVMAAFQTLVRRLDSGRWGDTTSAADMNATAAATGLGPGAFQEFTPARFLRPFDVRNLDREGED